MAGDRPRPEPLLDDAGIAAGDAPICPPFIEDFGDVGSWAELVLFPPWQGAGDGRLANCAFLQAIDDVGRQLADRADSVARLSFHANGDSNV